MENEPFFKDLDRLLTPMLNLEPFKEETPMSLTVGEGLVLPNIKELKNQYKLREFAMWELYDTLEWLCLVIQPPWLINDLNDRLCPVRNGINGEDAFIGAWEIDDNAFQLAVTRERIHLLTQIKNSKPKLSDKKKGEKALELANELFQLPDKPLQKEWKLRVFGGLLMGYRDMPFKRNWYETLMFLTDGEGVKYSVLKYKDRISPEERDSPHRIVVPWFEVE